MKHLFLALALLSPGLALAYPNPNVTLKTSTGTLVDAIWTQPFTGPLIVAEGLVVPTTLK